MEDLTKYDYKPEEMLYYLSHYGWHFNKRMCEFAVSKMKKNGASLQIMQKEYIDNMLIALNIKIADKGLYDYIYVANMLKADLLGNGIPDEPNLFKAVKAYLEDEDGYDGLPFTRWYADMCKKGIIIDWEKMI